MNRTTWLLLAALAVPAPALVACGGGGNDSVGPDPDDRSCTTCHGSSTNAAPPSSTTGATATTDLAVGAHQVHLQGGVLGMQVACNECHLVPSSNDHADGTNQVVFGTFARTGGLTPTWNREAATCSNVYCHGSGGSASSPVWTLVDGSQTTCGSCHGDPPTANDHPQVATAYCSGCHPATMTAAGELVGGGKHLDGSIEAVAFDHPSSWLASGHKTTSAADAGASCKPCHGDDLRGGTSGRSCYTCHPVGPPI
ncbi:MAG: CxxxxCH/CxxCH domain-containing protein [Anaeromyxobacter sp.]